MSRLMTAAGLALAIASMSQAAITYVDAQPDGPNSNVTVQGAMPTDTTIGGPALAVGTNMRLNQPDATNYGETDDGVWGERNRTTVNGGQVLVSKGAADGTDDGNGILWTSSPTLAAGTYEVYLFFWINSSGGGIWDCSAAIGALTSMGTMTDYTRANATDIHAATQFDGYDLPPGLVKTDGTQYLFAVKLGQAVLATDGPIVVSTAGRLHSSSSDNRTWYDGFGYQRIEPCTFIAPVDAQGPIYPGATSVTVSGVSPTADAINVYVQPGTLIGTLAGSAPNTPSTVVVPVTTSPAFGEYVYARQSVAGVEQCGNVTAVQVATPPRITFVDATPNTTGDDGNTTLDGNLIELGTNVTTGTGSGSTSDQMWQYRRRDLVNGGNVWETRDPEIVAPLVTTLSLPNGTYRLYGLFYNNASGTGAWDVSFKVDTGLEAAFGLSNASLTSAAGYEFFDSVLTRDGTQYLMIAPLGQYEITTGSVQVTVGAPMLYAAGEFDERTWYDGIGYELVTPGPTLPVTDGFGDGDRDNNGVLDNPDGSGTGVVDNAADVGLGWFQVFDGEVTASLKVAHDVAAPSGLGDDNALQLQVSGRQAYQVAAFPAAALMNPGDYLRLTAKVRFTGLGDSRDTLRFGLYNDGATPVTADAPTQLVVEDDLGYFATMATGPTPHTIRIEGNYSYNSDGAMFGLDELLTYDEFYAGTVNDSAPRTLSLTITRGINGEANLDYLVDGNRVLYAVDSTQPVLFFNEIAFGSIPVPGASYNLDDVHIESGTAMCQAISPVTVMPIIPVDATTIDVSGVVPQAEQVNVYLEGVGLIGTAAGSAPNTPDTVTVTLTTTPLPSGGQVTARQVVNGVESCWAAEVVKVDDCNAVTPVQAVGGLMVGDTSVTVVGVDPTASEVRVYADGPALLGSAPADGNTSILVSGLAPLTAGQVIKASQVLGGVESCLSLGGTQVLARKLTYVDAVPNTDGSDGNTTINGVLVDYTNDINTTTGTGAQSTTQQADGLWHNRSRDTVNGGNVWETDTTVGEDESTQPLITTLTLPPGTYELYAAIWNGGSNLSAWDIAFRVGTSGEYAYFNRTDSYLTSETGTEFTNPTSTRDSTQWLILAPMGRYSTAGTLDIYINGLTPDPTSGRTWYDGIAYVSACNDPYADVDGDQDVDLDDFALFQRCFTGSVFSGPFIDAACACLDRVPDGRIDGADLPAFMNCMSGSQVLALPGCDD